MINKKLESLENEKRKKNDSFMDLYEKMKAINFEPHHRTPSRKNHDRNRK